MGDFLKISIVPPLLLVLNSHTNSIYLSTAAFCAIGSIYKSIHSNVRQTNNNNKMGELLAPNRNRQAFTAEWGEVWREKGSESLDDKSLR